MYYSKQNYRICQEVAGQIWVVTGPFITANWSDWNWTKYQNSIKMDWRWNWHSSWHPPHAIFLPEICNIRAWAPLMSKGFNFIVKILLSAYTNNCVDCYGLIRPVAFHSVSSQVCGTTGKRLWNRLRWFQTFDLLGDQTSSGKRWKPGCAGIRQWDKEGCACSWAFSIMDIEHCSRRQGDQYLKELIRWTRDLKSLERTT
jgi:hypothetical protein